MTRVSAAIITNSDNEILICRRGPGGSCQFLWEFPGGKIEQGESPEELEIEIEVLDLFEETKYSYPEREIEFMFFSASLKKGVPTPNVHDSIKWVSPDMLGEYEFCPADVFVVERLAKEN